MKPANRIQKLEDLHVWCKARDLAKEVYQITKEGSFAKDFPLRDQIRRAAISISSNIAEGFGRYSAKEFSSFLSIASGSASEVASQILLAKELGHVSAEKAEEIVGLCTEIGKMISGLRKKLVVV